MNFPSRVELARIAYARALGAARERPTPVAWRRLVRAGQNLRDALAEQAGVPRGARPAVLLVDADAGSRNAARTILEASGLRVVTAEHGVEALDLLRRGRLRPRTIVLDLELPVMTGWELRSALLQDPALAGIPVIVLSRSLRPAPPAVRRLEKPFEPAALVDAIRSART